MQCASFSFPHSDRISCTQRIRGAELFVFIVEHGIAAGQHLIRAQGASQGRGVAELLSFVTELLLHRLLKLLLQPARLRRRAVSGVRTASGESVCSACISLL